MNSLVQQLNYLIGDVDAMEELAQKDKCRILVISDSHGNYYKMFDIIQNFGDQCDAMIFCGDGCGDIIYILEEAVHEEKFASKLPPVIGIVEGNNDCDSYPFAPDSKTVTSIRCPIRNTMKACGHNIFFTHGHRYSLFYGSEALIEASRIDDADIVLFGHTHVAYTEIKAPQVFVLNPGSCSRPRSSQPQCFAIIELKKGRKFADYTFYQTTSRGYIPYNPEGLW